MIDLQIIEAFMKLDGPTGVFLFLYMTYRFQRIETNIEKLNKRLDKFIDRLVTLEENIEARHRQRD